MVRMRSAVVPLLLTCMVASPVAAQDEGGLSVFLEWLHKLSGPEVGGFGASIYQGLFDDGPRIRLSVSYLVSYDGEEEIDPDDANISLLGITPSIEYPLGLDWLDASAGVTLNRFGGDADSFYHLSFPLMLQARPRLSSAVRLRLSAGTTIFPAFDEDDFEPLIVNVSRDKTEAVLRVVIGIDWERGSWFD